jgi:RNA polymerase sigma-70 factor, ECF subfamily
VVGSEFPFIDISEKRERGTSPLAKFFFADVYFRSPGPQIAQSEDEGNAVAELPADVTLLLERWSNGDQKALDELVNSVYGELQRMANRYLRSERTDHTLEAPALVNEAYLRLVDQRGVQWKNRAHFFGVASHIMRHILVDYAKGRTAAKRGGTRFKLSLDEALDVCDERGLDLLALNDSLSRLAAMDEQTARIVEMRFFGGLSIDETATVLAVSPSTVDRGWRFAKAWLYSDLQLGDPSTAAHA